MVMEMSRDHQLVRSDLRENRPQLAFHGFSGTDSGICQRLLDLSDLKVGGVFSDVVNGSGYRTRHPSPKVDKGLLDGTELAARLLIGFGGKDIHADHGIGLLTLRG